MAMSVFPCRLSGYTFRRDVGGGGGDSDLPFASKVKFSSRVHLLDKIGKKHFERKTELF